MNRGLYILNKDGKPVPEPDTIKWAKWFAAADRRVAVDWVEECQVSTVFLGLDHSFTGGTPILWETMIFNGPLNFHMRRCAGTWEQAEAMHRDVVNEVLAHYAPKTGFTIAKDGQSITCHTCGRTSWNINDVRQLYCGACKKFHQLTT